MEEEEREISSCGPVEMEDHGEMMDIFAVVKHELMIMHVSMDFSKIVSESVKFQARFVLCRWLHHLRVHTFHLVGDV